MRIEHTLRIDAPLETVWEVIIDFASYGEWNPFVVGAESSLRVGEPIDMKVKMVSFFAQPQRETVREYRAGDVFCYGLESTALGALRSRRCHEVVACATGVTEYRSRFALEGWLSPLVGWLAGGRLRWGFESMSDGIKSRAEILHRAGSARAVPDR